MASFEFEPVLKTVTFPITTPLDLFTVTGDVVCDIYYIASNVKDWSGSKLTIGYDDPEFVPPDNPEIEKFQISGYKVSTISGTRIVSSTTIKLYYSTALLSQGTIKFYCVYAPLSEGAKVEAAE